MRGENLLVGTHKISTDEFCNSYDNTIWETDPEHVKEEKRKRQALAEEKADCEE